MPWLPIDTTAGLPPDGAAFVNTIDMAAGFFDPAQSLAVARAPGRLDLMGGIADYSGALVLELPLGVAAYAVAQRSEAPAITIRSFQSAQAGDLPEVSIALSDLAPGGTPVPYPEARALLSADPRAHWAAYVAGALVVLGHERGLAIERGVRLLLDSQVPPGKGVSSSAAIEVAAMRAICAVYGVELAGRELAILCQKVENLVVGAPCGVMDQMTSACGEQDMLFALLCQPAELEPPVALPPDLAVWGIDSGIRHAVSGADYGSVRVGAFMGYRIICEYLGSDSEQPAGASAAPPYGGYLANVAPSEWEGRWRERVPETISGADFMARYGGTADTVTRVDPARAYAVRQPTVHPIYEHHRVRLFRALLQCLTKDHRPKTKKDATADSLVFGRSPLVETAMLLGELMFQSHASYGACGLGSDGTDRLVELVRAAGPERGLYGAKITGGGSGGTVAVLARRDADAAVRAIAARYERETGRSTIVLHGSSPGAQQFGVVWLRFV
jgi:L-arabinokinase